MYRSVRGSVIPASITGSMADDDRYPYTISPTITECANEPQMESKSQMREKISKLGPKLVSPKRTLGTGPVLVGKLDTVEEVKEVKENSFSISLPSISSSASGPLHSNNYDTISSTFNKYDTISSSSNITKREKTASNKY